MVGKENVEQKQGTPDHKIIKEIIVDKREACALQQYNSQEDRRTTKHFLTVIPLIKYPDA